MNNNYQYNLSHMLSVYQSNVAASILNLYNYHWNLVGESFFPLHKKLQEYYEHLTEVFDSTSERIKQLGGYPVASLKDLNDLSTVKNVPSKDYNQKEVIRGVIGDFGYLLDITKQIMDFSSQINDQVTMGLMIEYATWLEKQLWMLNANLK